MVTGKDLEGCTRQGEGFYDTHSSQRSHSWGSTEVENQQAIWATLQKFQQRRPGSKKLPPVTTGAQTQAGKLMLYPRSMMLPCVVHQPGWSLLCQRPHTNSLQSQVPHWRTATKFYAIWKKSLCRGVHAQPSTTVSESHDPCILCSCSQQKQPEDAA